MDETRRGRDGSGKGPVRRVLEWLGIVGPSNEARLLAPWAYGALAVVALAIGVASVLDDEFRVRVVGVFLLAVGFPGMVFLGLLSRRKRTGGA